MSTKYPQGVITATPPFQSTTAQSFSGVWTLEQLGKNYFYYQQPVAKSLRFRSSASAYLNRTPSTGGNRTTWTWSAWVKRGTLGSAQIVLDCDGGVTDTTFGAFGFTAADAFEFLAYNTVWRVTSQVFRDPSSWYHIVLTFDTTQAAAANRIKIYVNGYQITAFSTSNDPAQNTSYAINQAAVHNIAKLYGGRGYFDGYLAEINFIDGQALDPSYFGQLSTITGVWAPKKYVGSYGTNGFYLPFTNATSTTTIGYDASGNGNNWTTSSISLTAGSTYDSMWDSPTSYDNGGNGVGNYAVLNPLYAYSSLTLSGANLNAASTANYRSAISTIGVSSGKWYWEYVVTAVGNDTVIGITSNPTATVGTYAGGDAASWGYEALSGNKYNNGAFSAYGAAYTTNDVIGIAFDANAGSLTFYKNGVSQGVAYSGLASGTYYAAFGLGNPSTGSANFGQRPFAYTPPTGFKALNTQNLPAVSIANGANHMAATLYTGNGGTQSIINAANSVSFKPDLVWCKARSVTASNVLNDSVRGISRQLTSNGTAAEALYSGYQVVSFNSNGFTVTDDSSGGYGVNGPAGGTYSGTPPNYIAWQWKAGGTAVTNTAGSITSSVSANPTAGFSVLTFTTQSSGTSTIGHGLGVAPSLIILKGRALVTNWSVYHTSVGNTGRLVLNTTAPTDTNVVYWNNTSPTSSVFTLGTNYADSSTYVAYCFAAIPGYSAFGSYTGNGSTDGPFVYLGFRPRFILWKCSSSPSDWMILDTSRNTYNETNSGLFPDVSIAESTASIYAFDIVSNGFKVRTSNATINGSGATSIYAAFAENPFKYSLAR